MIGSNYWGYVIREETGVFLLSISCLSFYSSNLSPLHCSLFKMPQFDLDIQLIY